MYWKIEKCRLCGSGPFESILDLGSLALTGVFPKPGAEKVPSAPIELIKCARCHLVQLRHSYEMSSLYGKHYGYRSGLNRSMVRHLERIVKHITSLVSLTEGDIIVDIGSNDGTLLRRYPSEKYRLFGIDPTGEKFKDFYPPWIELVCDFFSPQALSKVMLHEKAKVISSIAMFYDLEDPLAFVQGVRELLSDEGIWVFEQSYLPTMLDQNAYDTICHEHLEYYALSQIKWLVDKARMKIVDVELNAINGGSIRITAAKEESKIAECKLVIDRILKDENQRMLSSLKPYQEFASRVEQHREDLLRLLRSLRNAGKVVFGYGASTKGNVLLQYCALSPEHIPFVAEVNTDKFGAFTPGTNIPIVSEGEARSLSPDYFLVLPWHFRESIIEREVTFSRKGGKFLFPLPEIEIIGTSEKSSPYEKSVDNWI